MINFSEFEPALLDNNPRLFKYINELTIEYPFTKIIYRIPYNQRAIDCLKIVAVNSKVIKAVNGVERDFLGKYSKLIYVVIPPTYAVNGCYVYGAKWENLFEIPYEDRHIDYGVEKDGYHKLCVGVPQSFKEFKNPILESVRTAERILTAYELYLCGTNKSIDLNAYSHGKQGEIEYEKKNNRYRTK